MIVVSILYTNGFNFSIIPKVNAEVAGMNKYDLKYDYDFKGAVEDIIEDCDVDGEEIYC